MNSLLRSLFSVVALCIMGILIFSVSAQAIEGTLSWSPSPDPDVVGYKVYVGAESGKYAYSIDVGLQTSFDLSNLEPEEAYYFAVTAYSADGQESDYSQELVSGSPTGKPMPYKLISGLGDYPEHGGWLELLGADYLHDSWLQVEWEEYVAENGEARVASGDIDGDGKDEVVVGLAPVEGVESVPGGWFTVYDDDYTLLAADQIQWTDYNALNGETWPACGDLDGDGREEIILGLGSGGKGQSEIFSYTSSGLEHRGWIQIDWEDYNTLGGVSHPACGDIDGDGKDEIIVGFSAISEESAVPEGWFQVFDNDLSSLAWGQISWVDYNLVSGETWPSSGDVNGDGVDEIILGLGQGGEGRFETQAYASGNMTHTQWNEVAWDDYNILVGETHPTCGDLDADLKAETLVGLGKGGKAVMQIFDDLDKEGQYITSLQVEFQDYQTVNGETWPAVAQVIAASGSKNVNINHILYLLLM